MSSVPNASPDASVHAPGWAALPNWIVRDPTLSVYAKAVLLVISSHVDRDGYALSQALIAREVGCSPRQVRNVLPGLQARGLVVVQPTFRDREQGPNLYRLAFDLSGTTQSEQVAPPATPPGTTFRAPLHQVPTEEEPREEEPIQEHFLILPDEEFEKFWNRYPRRIGKADAIKAWPEALRVAGSVEVILDGLRRMPTVRKKQFIPYPATWLRACRWEDEPDQTQTQQLEGYTPR